MSEGTRQFGAIWTRRRYHVVGDQVFVEEQQLTTEEAFPDAKKTMEAVKKRSKQRPIREDHEDLIKYFDALRRAGPPEDPPSPEALPDPDDTPASLAPVGEGISGVDDTKDRQGGPYLEEVDDLTLTADPGPTPPAAAQLSMFAPYPPWAVVLDPPPNTAEEAEALLQGKTEPASERSLLHSGQRTRAPTADGDPVDLFSGRLTMTHVDIAVATSFIPLRLVRTYRNGLPYFGPWGYNWDHNYNVYLRELADGGVARWTGQMHEDHFRWTGNGFEPDYGVHERLERLSSHPPIYVLTFPGGMQLHFEHPSGWSTAERIPLVMISDRHGNTQRLHYDTRDRVEHVRDEAGRGLTFRYGTCDLLERVEDHTGKDTPPAGSEEEAPAPHVEYLHHSEIEHLVGVRTAPTAAYPKGALTSYEYDFLNPHPGMQHNILTITDAEDQVYLQNEYGGPETGWGFNRVIGQLYGDFPYQFEYEQLQYVPENPLYVDIPAIRTVVRPPDGSLHTYTFNYRGDLLDHRFRLNQDGSYRVVSYQWEYDEQGNITKETGPGGVTHFGYDDFKSPNPCDRGNLRSLTRAVPGASRTLFEAVYEPKYQLPLKIYDESKSETTFHYKPDPSGTGRLERIELPAVKLPDGTPQHSKIWFETNSRGQLTATISSEGIRDGVEYYPPAASPQPAELPLLEGFIKKTVQDVSGVAFVTEYVYDTFGRLKQLTNPAGSVMGFRHNALGQLEDVILPPVAGSTASIRAQFTKEGAPIRFERPRGAYEDPVITGDAIIDEYLLDVLGNVREVIGGANTAKPRRIKSICNHRGQATETIDPLGLRVRCDFDERGLLLRRTVGAGTAPGLTTKWTYETDGLLRRVEEPDGTSIEVEKRDLWHRPLDIRLPNGALLKFEWPKDFDRPQATWIEEVLASGATKTRARQEFDYDERGRLVQERAHVLRSDPSPPTVLSTTYTHDADDRIREIHFPRGGVLRCKPDGLDRLVHVQDVYGNLEDAAYDTATNTVVVTKQEVEPTGTRTSTWRYEHDERGRLAKLTEPGGAEIQYVLDDRDLLVERHEPLDVVTRLRYGLLGELEHTVADPAGLNIEARYEYDLVGRLERFIDPTGEVTQWTHDVLGRNDSTLLPDGSVWRRSFNNQGQLAAQTSPTGSQFVFTYHPKSGELETMACVPAAGEIGIPKQAFAYDVLGRLVQASVPGHTVIRKYDSLGRLLSESAEGQTVGYEYDDLAGVIDLIYPDGRKERTTTDLGGRPVQVSLVSPGSLGGVPGAPIAHLVYAGAERLHSIEHGNGVTTELTYDDALRLIRVEHTHGGKPLESCRYRYDARHRRRVTQLIGPPQVNRVHVFDAHDRLRQVFSEFSLPSLADAMSQQQQDSDILAAEHGALSAQRKETFWLDDADSRQELLRTDGDSFTSTPYLYEAGHKVIKAGTELMSYHPTGSRQMDARYKYDIDALGRVVRIRDAAASSQIRAEFSYDALSRPHAGHVDGEAFQRWYVRDRGLLEIDTSGNERQISLHPVWPLPLQERSPTGTFVAHPDGSASSICVTDQSGAVVEHARFESFGEASRFTSDGITPLIPTTASAQVAFGGMPYLDPLGLYWTPRRLYDPRHGLFLAPDPLLYSDSPSSYLYSQHNPIDFIDPQGTDKHKPDTETVAQRVGGAPTRSFADQQVDQLQHAAWDAFVESTVQAPFDVAALSLRTSAWPLLLVGLDLGARPERLGEDATAPLKFGPPKDPRLLGTYEEHRFGAGLFFNALLLVGRGPLSGAAKWLGAESKAISRVIGGTVKDLAVGSAFLLMGIGGGGVGSPIRMGKVFKTRGVRLPAPDIGSVKPASWDFPNVFRDNDRFVFTTGAGDLVPQTGRQFAARYTSIGQIYITVAELMGHERVLYRQVLHVDPHEWVRTTRGLRYGTAKYGTVVEPLVLRSIEEATGTSLLTKHGNTVGADILPAQLRFDFPD